MLRVHLLRHGQTECSRAGRMCGMECDAELNEAGLAMAKAIAGGLADLRLTGIVASPLARAQATAAPLAARLGLSVTVDPDWAEVNLGEWEGLTPREIETRDPVRSKAWRDEPTVFGPPSGELIGDVQRRADRALARLRQQDPGEILVVAHKTVLRVAICSVLGMPIGDYRRRIAQPLGGHTIIDFEKSGALLRLHGSLAHLPPELRNAAGS